MLPTGNLRKAGWIVLPVTDRSRIRQNVPMSAPWVDSVTPIPPPRTANPRIRDLLYAALVTGIWSGLICSILYWICRAAGVPFLVVTRSVDPLAQVPWYAPLFVPVAFAGLGALACALVRGRAHARKIVLWFGTLLALGSGVGPLTQPDEVIWSTRIWLLVMHVITWFLVVPQLARIVGDSEPGMSVPGMSMPGMNTERND